MLRNCARLAVGLSQRHTPLHRCPAFHRLSSGLCQLTPKRNQDLTTTSSAARLDLRKDFALPNGSWKKELMDLYDKFMEMTKTGTWKKLPSYRSTALHLLAVTHQQPVPCPPHTPCGCPYPAQPPPSSSLTNAPPPSPCSCYSSASNPLCALHLHTASSSPSCGHPLGSNHLTSTLAAPPSKGLPPGLSFASTKTDPSSTGRTRLFSRNLDEEGTGLEYATFLNLEDKRIVGLFQTGPYLEGPPGFTHGGCIATIIDAVTGSCAIYAAGKVMTANLNINYRNPVPLGSVVVVESHVDRIEDRKIFLSCRIRSADDTILHTEATALFIKLKWNEVEQ